MVAPGAWARAMLPVTVVGPAPRAAGGKQAPQGHKARKEAATSLRTSG